MRPNTIQEWTAYARGLAGKELRAQTETVNSMAFIRQMGEEGHDADHCQDILLVFIRRCRETGAGLPKGGMWDLSRLATGDVVCSYGEQISESEADAYAAAWKPPQDDVDRFCLEAAYETE